MFPPPAHLASEGVLGSNLRVARFGEGNARFEETAFGTWVQYRDDGSPVQTLRETGRDDWEVNLQDLEGTFRVRLDVSNRKILTASQGARLEETWDMTQALRVD